MEIQGSSNQNSYSSINLDSALESLSRGASEIDSLLSKTRYDLSGASGASKVFGFDVGEIWSQGKALFGDLGDLGSFISNAAVQQKALGKGGIAGALELGQEVWQSYATIAGIPTPTVGELAKIVQGGDLGQLAQNYLLRNFGREALDFGLTRLGLDATAFGTNELVEAAAGYLSGKSGLEVGYNLLKGQVGSELFGASTAGAIGQAGALAGTAFNTVGAGISFYNIFKNFGQTDPGSGLIQGAVAGAQLGSVIPGLGTVVGGVVGGAIGLVSGLFKTGKHKDQVARDQIRKSLRDAGLIDKNWCVTLADGSKFDIGKDGGAKLNNVDGTKRRMYEVDFKNPLAGETVAMAQGLAAVLTGGNKKLKDDFTGYLTNAALSNATTIEEARANLTAIVKQMGINPAAVEQGIQQLSAQGSISADEARVFQAGFQQIRG